MTFDQYKAEAATIRANNPLSHPPEAVALRAYAQAFRELNERKEAERMAEYNAKLTEQGSK